MHRRSLAVFVLVVAMTVGLVAPAVAAAQPSTTSPSMAGSVGDASLGTTGTLSSPSTSVGESPVAAEVIRPPGTYHDIETGSTDNDTNGSSSNETPDDASGDSSDGTENASTGSSNDSAANDTDVEDGGSNQSAEEPETDAYLDEPIGQINGFRYNETIEVDQSDGLDDEELHAYLSRSMARVEHLRGLKFNREVHVEVISREEYRDRVPTSEREQELRDFNQWNDVVWRSLFIVDNETSVEEAFDSVRIASVGGFYDTTTGNVTIVSDDPDEATIDEGTLIHELTHALQDQHFDLEDDRFVGQTQDEQLAILGLIEGDADYVRMRYVERCEASWHCVQTPDAGGDRELPSDFNYGVWAVLFQPYSDGPAYVHERVERGGWGEINELYEDPPVTSHEIIHRESLTHEPVPYEDTSRSGWHPFDEQGVNGTDRLGEASIFGMFWYQSYLHDTDGMFEDLHGSFLRDDHPYSVHDYRSRFSSGWTNDVIVPYRSIGGDETGFVWKSTWETEEEAEEFRRAYVYVLAINDGRRLDRATWEVAEDGYGGVYRIVREGRAVTIVNGPTVAAVEDLRPGLEVPEEPPRLDIDPLEPPNRVVDPSGERTTDPPLPPRDSVTENAGLGAIVALVAVLVGAGLLVRRTRRRR